MVIIMLKEVYDFYPFAKLIYNGNPYGVRVYCKKSSEYIDFEIENWNKMIEERECSRFDGMYSYKNPRCSACVTVYFNFPLDIKTIEMTSYNGKPIAKGELRAKQEGRFVKRQLQGLELKRIISK